MIAFNDVKKIERFVAKFHCICEQIIKRDAIITNSTNYYPRLDGAKFKLKPYVANRREYIHPFAIMVDGRYPDQRGYYYDLSRLLGLSVDALVAFEYGYRSLFDPAQYNDDIYLGLHCIGAYMKNVYVAATSADFRSYSPRETRHLVNRR